VFQIGKSIKNISNFETFIKLLDNGFKFVPCLHLNDYFVFRSLLVYFENNLCELNKKFFIAEKTHVNGTLNLGLNSIANSFSLTASCDSID